MDDPGFDIQSFARDLHELLVLSTLREGAKHGYQIALDVESESNGLFHFKHGSLYPILHRMEREGLIDGSWSSEDGRRKKVYSLTRTGERHLIGGTSRMEHVVSGLMRLLRGPGEARA
jgi:DNA-binding PadR family transcriptional regulator